MFKLRRVKNWGFVLSLLLAILALPVGTTVCAASCPMHQTAAETSENCCDQIVENHCPPKSGSGNQNTHPSGEMAALNNAGGKIQIGCRCVKDAPQRQTVLAKQEVRPQHWFPIISRSPQLILPPVNQTAAIVFFKPNVVYPARSSLTDLPARAPPIL